MLGVQEPQLQVSLLLQLLLLFIPVPLPMLIIVQQPIQEQLRSILCQHHPFSVTETSGTNTNDGITCSGASVGLAATGGTSYVWSTGATTASITVSPTTNNNLYCNCYINRMY